MVLKVKQAAKVMGLALALSSCSGSPQYPKSLGADINPNFEFSHLRAAVSQYKGSVFQLGGEIMQATPVSDGVLILAQRRWVREDLRYPGYRPEETGEVPADQFLLLYPGTVDAQGLLAGNKFVAVAELEGTSRTGDAKRPAPEEQFLFRARCMHVWKTGKNRIADFPDRYPQLYAPLEQDTYCAGASQSPARN